MRPILLWIVTLLPLMSPVGALVQDNGNGMYTNPPLYADYPDPDIIRGLRARGGYVVDVAWKDGKLARAVLHSGREPQRSHRRTRNANLLVGTRATKVSLQLRAFHRAASKNFWPDAIGVFRRPQRRIGRRSAG